MRCRNALILVLSAAAAAALACTLPSREPTSTPAPTPTQAPTPIPMPDVQPGEADPNEPVLIRGTIPFTSPFFINSIALVGRRTLR